MHQKIKLVDKFRQPGTVFYCGVSECVPLPLLTTVTVLHVVGEMERLLHILVEYVNQHEPPS
jgi:hypothetical protein